MDACSLAIEIQEEAVAAVRAGTTALLPRLVPDNDVDRMAIGASLAQSLHFEHRLGIFAHDYPMILTCKITNEAAPQTDEMYGVGGGVSRV